MEKLKQFIYHYTEKCDRQDLRGKWVIPRYGDSLYFFGVFTSRDSLERFARKIGFSFKLYEKSTGLVTYECDRSFRSAGSGGFWSLDEIPEGAKPIKALSNGSIVDCFFTNDGNEVVFYRPNPNAKDVYKPLALRDHIEYTIRNGTF